MAIATWTDQQKAQALALAEATTIREASAQTGIPEGTIKRWRSQLRQANRTERGEPTEPNRVSRKMQQVAEEALEEARPEIAAYAVDKGQKVVDKIMELIEKAVDAAVETIEGGPCPDTSSAQWLRALIGAMAQGVEKSQLLRGQPTEHHRVEGEMSTTHEQRYHVINELVTNPEIAQLVRDSFRQRIRMGSGSPRL